MGRTLVVGLIALVLLGGAAVAAVLRDDNLGPLPSEDELRTNGFAVWPEDTLAEGMDACDEAESWRLDPEETALHFARAVLNYPQPNLHPLDPNATRGRFLINTDGIEEVYLGSVIDVRKYDRCWFVVHAEPREDAFFPTVAYVHGTDGPQLAIGDASPGTQIGYGSWDREIDGGGLNVLDLPKLEPDATGHIMTLTEFEEVNDVDARSLGFVPDPATERVGPASLSDLSGTPGICRPGEGFHSARAALAHLYTWTFGNPGGNEVERIRGDKWLLKVDDAELQAGVPQVREGCWRVTSVRDGNSELLKSLRVAEDSLTFDLNWGRATWVRVILGSTRGGDGWHLERMPGPITVASLFPEPLSEPFYVTVVLTRGGRVISAMQSWYLSP